MCGLLTIIIVKFNYLKNLVYICAWLCEINILYLTRRTMSSQTLRQEFMHVSWRTMARIPTFCPKITWPLKFIYSEKVTKFCEITTVDLSYVVRSNLHWRFCKILWPFQNIWTLIIEIWFTSPRKVFFWLGRLKTIV